MKALIGSEYTTLYLPLEHEYALDLVGYYIKDGKDCLVLSRDEIFLHLLSLRAPFISCSLGDEELKTVVLDMGTCKDIRIEKLKKQGRLLILCQNLVKYNLTESTATRLQGLAFIRSLLFPSQLMRNLKKQGFLIETVLGLHTPKNILIGRFVNLLRKLNLPHMEDRFHFKNRNRYITESPMKYLSTVLFIVARRGDDKHG